MIHHLWSILGPSINLRARTSTLRGGWDMTARDFARDKREVFRAQAAPVKEHLRCNIPGRCTHALTLPDYRGCHPLRIIVPATPVFAIESIWTRRELPRSYPRSHHMRRHTVAERQNKIESSN
jgi:hypothetical protein